MAQFSISRAYLLDLLKAIKTVPVSPVMDASKQVRLTVTKDGTISATATDAEQVIYCTSCAGQATVIKTGSLDMQRATLLEVVKSMSSETISFQIVSDAHVQIKADRSEFKLLYRRDDYFDGIKSRIDAECGKNAQTIQFETSDLTRFVHGVSVCVATDDSRYGLNGAYLHTLDHEGTSVIRMVSTDGHRLAYYQRTTSDRMEYGILLPRPLLRSIVNLSSQFGPKVDLKYSRNMLTIQGETPSMCVTLQGRLLEGEFPNYVALLPNQTAPNLSVDTAQLTQAIRRVTALGKVNKPSARFTGAGESLVVKMSDIDTGMAQETLEASVASDLSVAINPAYVREMLDTVASLGPIESSRVGLNCASKVEPVMFRFSHDEASVWLIMPMRDE